MKILTEYSKNGYDFTIVKRQGNLAIAKGIHQDHGAENWEIILIRSHNGLQMGNNWVESKEFPPSNAEWGMFGWTALNAAHAEEIFTKKLNGL